MHSIGKRIKKFRKEKNLSMSALAMEVGVSRSLISQVEKDEAYPSLKTLDKIVEVLGISMSKFFQIETEESNEDDVIIRSGSHSVIFMQDSKIKYHLLSPNIYQDMEFVITEFPPYNSEYPIDYFKHEGYEHFYVLTGQLHLTIGEETYIINEDDSGCFDAGQLHYFINKTDKVAKIIVAATEPSTQIRTHRMKKRKE